MLCIYAERLLSLCWELEIKLCGFVFGWPYSCATTVWLICTSCSQTRKLLVVWTASLHLYVVCLELCLSVISGLGINNMEASSHGHLLSNLRWSIIALRKLVWHFFFFFLFFFPSTHLIFFSLLVPPKPTHLQALRQDKWPQQIPPAPCRPLPVPPPKPKRLTSPQQKHPAKSVCLLIDKFENSR